MRTNKGFVMTTAKAEKVSPEQARAARYWLGWNSDQLAEAAECSGATVIRFENGEGMSAGSRLLIQTALEREGFSFEPVNGLPAITFSGSDHS